MSEELHDTVGKIIAVARDKYTVHECNECNWRKCCELKFDSAECREEREDIFLSLGIEDGYFSDLLNRIEAEWKREREADTRLLFRLLWFDVADYESDRAVPMYQRTVDEVCRRVGVPCHDSGREIAKAMEEHPLAGKGEFA